MRALLVAFFFFEYIWLGLSEIFVLLRLAAVFAAGCCVATGALAEPGATCSPGGSGSECFLVSAAVSGGSCGVLSAAFVQASNDCCPFALGFRCLAAALLSLSLMLSVAGA